MTGEFSLDLHGLSGTGGARACERSWQKLSLVMSDSLLIRLQQKANTISLVISQISTKNKEQITFVLMHFVIGCILLRHFLSLSAHVFPYFLPATWRKFLLRSDWLIVIDLV